MPDEAGKDHRDIDRGDENESAGERCLRNAGNDARKGDAHHEKEDGVEQEGRDGPEGEAEGTQVHHVGANAAPGGEDTCGDDGENAGAVELLRREVGDERRDDRAQNRQEGVIVEAMMRGSSVVKVRPQSRPAPAPAPMDSTNWVITLDVVTLWPLSAMLRAIAKIARAIVGEREASAVPGMNEAPTPAAMRSTGPIRLNLLVRRMQHTAAIPRTMIASTVMVPLSGGILL